MEFSLTPDQSAAMDAIERLARQFETKPTEFDGFVLQSAELEEELEKGGYFDIASVPEMGPVTAAMAVERLARSPYTAEVALSMLLRPQLDSLCIAIFEEEVQRSVDSMLEVRRSEETRLRERIKSIR